MKNDPRGALQFKNRAAPRGVAAFVAPLIAIGLLAGCSGNEDRPTASADALASEAEQRIETVCREENYECLEHGGNTVVLVKSPTSKAAPLLLWEPGGPGLNVLELIPAPPEWMADWNVVVVPERWTYAGSPECTDETCGVGDLSPGQYRAVVEAAQAEWGSIEEVHAFSYGAVRASWLLWSSTLPTSSFTLSSPAPTPGTSGNEIGRLRLKHAKIAAVDALECETPECKDEGKRRLQDFLNGKLGITAEEAGKSLLAITNGSGGNGDFLKQMLKSDADELTRRQKLSLRRASFAFGMEGQDVDSRRQAATYMEAICNTYPFQFPDSNPYVSIHETCGSNAAVGTEAHTPIDAENVTIEVNATDPVIPPQLQREWIDLLKGAHVDTYSEPAHVALDRTS